jgi:hypothetical protein
MQWAAVCPHLRIRSRYVALQIALQLREELPGVDGKD